MLMFSYMVGGCVQQDAYVIKKKKRKEKKKREDLKKTVEHIAIKYYRKESYKVHFSFYSCYIIKVYLLICIAMIEKKSGVDGFSNMLRNYQSGS